MATKIEMPMTIGEFTSSSVKEWLKKEGDTVEKDETIVVTETEKVTTEIVAPVSGVLLRIDVPEDEEVKPGDILGWIGNPEEKLPPRQSSTATTNNLKKAVEVDIKQQQSSGESRLKITPIARNLAKKYNIDLSQVAGSGPGGRIVESDIREYLQEKEDNKMLEEADLIPFSGMRKVIAERMKSSAQESPHVTNFIEVDMTHVLNAREKMQKENGRRFSINDLLILAVSRALTMHPILNSTLDEKEGKIKIHRHINIGIAVDIGQGLVVPVIKGADELSLNQISNKARMLVEKAKLGTLSAVELSGGTFTITNLGPLGTELFTPIINPPESAILGVGSIVKKPAVIDGEIKIRDIMWLSLSYDHRVIDGAPAARFLRDIKLMLENPLMILFSDKEDE